MGIDGPMISSNQLCQLFNEPGNEFHFLWQRQVARGILAGLIELEVAINQ